MAKGKVPTLTLGDRLMLAREHAGIGSKEMAEHLKCSRHTITNWEKGRTNPSHAEVLEWARLTKYDLGWIMDGQIEYDDVAPVTALPSLTKEQLTQILLAQLLGDQNYPRSLGYREVCEAESLLGPDDLLDLTREPAVVIHLAHAN